MYLFLVSLTSDEVTAISQGTNVWETVERLQGDPSRLLNMEDAWSGLHFMLTGEVPILKHEAVQRKTSWYEDSLENILMGGTPTAYECGFGMVRYVTPEEAAHLAPLLAAVSVAEMRSWYSPEALDENRIPPPLWEKAGEKVGESDTSPRAWLLGHFVSLKRFYADAVQQKRGLLVYTT